MIPDIGDQEMQPSSAAEEAEGSLEFQAEEDKLMHSVLEHDDNTVKDGKLLSDVLNQGFSSFTPDMMFDSLTKDFATAKQIYGEKLIRLVTGYDANYVRKNINIPEFQRELNERMQKKAEDLKKEGYFDASNQMTDKGVYLASLILYTEELDNLIPKGIFGEKVHKQTHNDGVIDNTRLFRKGDSYRDLAMRSSLRQAIKRQHKNLQKEDLRVDEKKSKGSINIIYAMDASGSMKGKKIEAAKKAGIALAFKAIEKNDPVGLIVFGTEIKETIEPTLDFRKILRKITPVTAAKQTNLTDTIRKAVTLFPRGKATKHLTLLTDAVPTVGEDPNQEVLEAVSLARNSGITVSLIGINLDKDAISFAEKITSIGEGKLFVLRDLENLDKIILEDYHSL
ncbi:MAG: VWA domain-containing protein [Candidatus Woesearchaeota archaeon]